MSKLNQFDMNMVLARLPVRVKDVLVTNGSSVFVAGGMIRSCVAGEKINDVDIFTKDKETAAVLAIKLAAVYGVDRYATDYAYTIRPKDELCIQFIHRWTFGSPVDCVESFDFTIAQAAVWYDRDAGKWDSFCVDSFYADLAAKRLVYTSPVRNEDAGGSILRVLKFYQNGYRIPLTSLAAVIARLCQGVDVYRTPISDELALSGVFAGLLFEVDPNSVDRVAYIADVEKK